MDEKSNSKASVPREDKDDTEKTVLSSSKNVFVFKSYLELIVPNLITPRLIIVFVGSACHN